MAVVDQHAANILIFSKDEAIDLVKKIPPRPERAERLAALRAGMHLANANGLTRVHAAGGHFESGDFRELDLYDELLRHGDLTVRMQVAYFLDPPELRSQDLDAIESARKKYTGDWLEAGVVKLRLDGVIESHTAAVLDPYTDDPSTICKPRLSSSVAADLYFAGSQNSAPLREGAFADLVLFDQETVIDRSTFAKPFKISGRS